MARAQDQDFIRYTIRVPERLYRQLQQAAGMKSVNAEIAARLEQSFASGLDAGDAEIVARLQAPGMTLRDYFAGQALAGLIADRVTLASFSEAGRATGKSAERFAADTAYSFADAMLAAREAR